MMYFLIPAPVKTIEDLPIARWLTEEDHVELSYWTSPADVIPISFWPLVNGPNGDMISITLAMLWGWLRGHQTCPSCQGSMKLLKTKHNDSYLDCLHWQCNNDGIVKIRKKKVKRLEKKINCKKQLSIRKDSWLKVVKVPLSNILHAIFYWTKGFKLGYIAEFSEISD